MNTSRWAKRLNTTRQETPIQHKTNPFTRVVRALVVHQDCRFNVINTTSFSRSSNCFWNFPPLPIFTLRVSNAAPLFSDLIFATRAMVNCVGEPKEPITK